jgi:hypothetical protein
MDGVDGDKCEFTQQSDFTVSETLISYQHAQFKYRCVYCG